MMVMSKINVKLMSEETYATLKRNIDSYVKNFKDNDSDGSWINDIISEKAFEIKKFQIEDFVLETPEGPYDRKTDLKNAIT